MSSTAKLLVAMVIVFLLFIGIVVVLSMLQR